MASRPTTLTSSANGITIHRVPLRSCVWTRDDQPNRSIAVARRYRTAGKVLWLLRIEGHYWPITPDMGVARLARITGARMTHVKVKGFRTWQECDHEVARLCEKAAA